MTVTAVEKNAETLSMTITAVFTAPVERVWQVLEDPRQLERWWGPPTYPATVSQHDLTVGGRTHYVMTGPEGVTQGGWWLVSAVDAPRYLEFTNGFAGPDGEPDVSMPVTTIRIELSEDGAGTTTMAVRTLFPTAEAMRELVEMGMAEGMAAAMGQLDAVVGGPTT